jgi:hypothetical protein
MGKRSDFERVAKDYYPTPISAVEPLIKHLPTLFTYVEPCAGDGRLVEHITQLTSGAGWCTDQFDIDPQGPRVKQADALDLVNNSALYYITNPPWTRTILHPLIEHLAAQKPTWLLFDADWMHTKQSKPYMEYCVSIVSIGRVKWIEDSKHTGKDNCCWYLFDQQFDGYTTDFYGR